MDEWTGAVKDDVDAGERGVDCGRRIERKGTVVEAVLAREDQNRLGITARKDRPDAVFFCKPRDQPSRVAGCPVDECVHQFLTSVRSGNRRQYRFRIVTGCNGLEVRGIVQV